MRPVLFVLIGFVPSLNAQTSFTTERPVPPAPAAVPALTVEKPARRQAEAPRAEPVRAALPVQAALPETAEKGNVVLRSGDSFQLLMSGMPLEDAGAFPREYTIGQDGTINITYAGQIRAAGLSQSQLERAIEGRLIAEKIFRRPTATINVQAGARIVTIGGQVRAPNRLSWSPDLTMLSAIMACGGPGDFAGKWVHLIRNGQVQKYDYYKLQKNPADDPNLKPGDRVDYK